MYTSAVSYGCIALVITKHYSKGQRSLVVMAIGATVKLSNSLIGLYGMDGQ